jgi:hypothetical protein
MTDIPQRSIEQSTVTGSGQSSPAGLPTRRFLAVVVAIAGVQLIVAMDGPAAIFAFPRIQNELGLSDAGRPVKFMNAAQLHALDRGYT